MPKWVTYPKTLKDTDAAWLAGMIDGDGTVTIVNSGNKPHVRMKVAVVSVNEWILQYIKELVGAGFITHGKNRSSTNCRDIYVWDVGNFTAYELLKQLRPYIILKRAQVEIALRFGETLVPHRGIGPLSTECHTVRSELKAEIHELNRVGRR